jgi:hypothetical protein
MKPYTLQAVEMIEVSAALLLQKSGVNISSLPISSMEK